MKSIIAYKNNDIERIIQQLFDDPFKYNLVWKRNATGIMNRIQEKFDFNIAHDTKVSKVITLQEKAYFDNDNIVVSPECKLLNNVNNQALLRKISKTHEPIIPVEPRHIEPILHRHDFFELFYVYKGGCRSTVENQEINFFAGDVGLYNLNSIHRMYVPNDEDFVFNILIRKRMIDQAFLSILEYGDLFTNFFIDSLSNPAGNHIVLQGINQTLIETYIKTIIVEFFTDNRQNYLKALLICLLNEIGDHYKEQIQQRSYNKELKITILDVINHIEENLDEVTLETLAEYFHYSYSNMKYYIKKYTDKSLTELIQYIKIQRAQKLLQTSMLSIEEITTQAGYQDRSYLDKLFKKQYGMSMAKYRGTYTNI